MKKEVKTKGREGGQKKEPRKPNITRQTQKRQRKIRGRGREKHTYMKQEISKKATQENKHQTRTDAQDDKKKEGEDKSRNQREKNIKQPKRERKGKTHTQQKQLHRGNKNR